jgi:hypothetical protein
MIKLLLIFQLLSYPKEAVEILSHYIFGKGEDLVLSSDYFPISPVIKKNLQSMKVGESRKISFNQKEDWRLSYAINGFTLTKTRKGFKIYQYIKFDSSGKVYTYINLFGKKIKVYDNWVHAFNCTPYRLYYTYDKVSYAVKDE